MTKLKIKKLKFIIFLTLIIIINTICLIKLLFNSSSNLSKLLSDTYTEINCTKVTAINNYRMYKLKNVEDLEVMTQEWYHVTVDQIYDVRFKYEYTDTDKSKLRLYIDDIEINDDVTFTDEDKYNFVFYEFNNIFIIEHELLSEYNYVYFYIKEKGEIYKLEDEENYYLTGYDIDDDGINLSYTIIKDYDKPILKDGTILNICSDSTFKERKSDIFYFEINYKFDGVNLNRVEGSSLTFNKVKNNKKIINACRGK